jgi:myb proto-oncogene protein
MASAPGCASLNALDHNAAQAGVTQSPPSSAAAWLNFASQPLFLPSHGADHQYAVDGEFLRLCRAAENPYPENGAAAVASLLAQGGAGADDRSCIPAFVEPKGAVLDPAMGPVVDFMDAILGSSSTSAASASSVDSFSANTGMQLHWIP